MKDRPLCQDHMPSIQQKLAQAARETPSSNNLVGLCRDKREEIILLLDETSQSMVDDMHPIKRVMADIEDSILKHIKEQRRLYFHMER